MGFTRTKESFVCDHCGAHVEGNGYTNHCPHCLWSKHVDVDPGDRLSPCGGMMEPMALEGGSPDYMIVHHCNLCGFVRRNSVSRGDDPKAVLSLSGRERTGS